MKNEEPDEEREDELDIDPTLAMGSEGVDATLDVGAAEPSSHASSDSVFDGACPLIRGIEIDGELGRGGQGVVYRGRQTMLDRAVAVKLLDASSVPSFQKRFRREAKILAAMVHPHIVTCYQADVTDDGHSYMVMEFIDGPDLFRWVKKNGALGVVDALTIARDVAEALRHALEDYEEAVIHRDIKPHNILLQPLKRSDCAFPFRAKVADLGLARSTSDETAFSNLTVAGSMLGTPATMAPEQFEDPDEVDFRADIYGLGCVLYHALAGDMPFRGKSIPQIFKQKTLEEVPEPKATRGELSSGLRALVKRMLHPDREGRPQSYAELIAALDAEIAELGPSCATIAGGAEDGDGDPHTLPWRVLVPAGVALALALVLVAVFSGDETEPADGGSRTAQGEGEPGSTLPEAGARGGTASEEREPNGADPEPGVPGAPSLAFGEERTLVSEFDGEDADWRWSVAPPRSDPPSLNDIWTTGDVPGAITANADPREGSELARASVGLPSGAWSLTGTSRVAHQYQRHAADRDAEAELSIQVGAHDRLVLLQSKGPRDRDFRTRWRWLSGPGSSAETKWESEVVIQREGVSFAVTRAADGGILAGLGMDRPQLVEGLRAEDGGVRNLELVARNGRAVWTDLVLRGGL